MSLNDIKQIGIVGGGPSSLMLCMEAARLGINTCILDPKVDCVGSRICNEHIVGAINNENIKKLSLRCDCVIYNTRPEFEMNVKLHSNIYPEKDNINELYNFKNIMDILELLEIPTSKIFYQENNKDAFKKLEGLTMPFRFIKLFKDYTKQMDIFSKDDLNEFLLEMEEMAEGFILQPISGYKHIAACVCVVDDAGKVYQYSPIDETADKDNDNEVCRLSLGTGFTKSMIAKLAKYNRKLLKEINAKGVYTIKYGVKANKSVEFIEITPELGLGSVLIDKAYDYSVFEQYIKIITGMKIKTPYLSKNVYGIVEPAETEIKDNLYDHIFKSDIVNLYMNEEKIEL